MEKQPGQNNRVERGEPGQDIGEVRLKISLDKLARTGQRIRSGYR
jgi:hypothetical protein